MGGWRRALSVVLATLGKVFWEPIREGSPRPRDWPWGLRTVMVFAGAAYLLAIGLVLASGWIRSNDTLVQYYQSSFPSSALTVLLWLLVLTLALALSAALHAHPVIGLLAFGLGGVLLLDSTGSAAGWPAWATRIAVLSLLVFYLLRVRRRFAWFEFPVVLVLMSLAVFAPSASMRFGGDWDLRPGILGLALADLVVVTAPALAMAGYASVEIAVSLGEWLLNRVQVETGGSPRRQVVLATALALGLAVFGYDLFSGLIAEEWEFRGEAWFGSAVTITVASLLCWLMLRRCPGVAPTRPTAEKWTGYAYVFVIVWAAAYLLAVSVLAPVGRVLGNQALAELPWEPLSDAFSSWSYLLVSVVLGLVWSFRARRRGERAAPVLLLCFVALTGLSLVSTLTNGRYYVSWSLPTLVALAVGLCLALVPVAMFRRRGVERQLWIALLALFISAMVGRREALSEPGALVAGGSGLAVLLFGLVWRVLTDAGITRRGSRWFPVPTRVLFYAATAMLAAVAVAYLALFREENALIDLEAFAAAGENLVGMPLILGAILLGAFSTLGLPVPARPSGLQAQRGPGHRGGGRAPQHSKTAAITDDP